MDFFTLKDLKRANSEEGGFSLIEVALALVIISMISVPMFMLYAAEAKRKLLTDTNTKLANIENAINQYFFAGNGSYPCPSSLIIGEGNNDYGVAFPTCVDLNTIRNCSAPAWDTNEGLCKTTNNPVDAVLIGAVPFDALGITPKAVLDSWGNKILYAVTYAQTQAGTFNTNLGEVVIWSFVDHDTNKATAGVPQNVTDPADRPDFVLISAGEAGIGAFTAGGVRTSTCPTVTNDKESENCDLDNVFFLDVNPTNPDEGSRSFQANSSYYDDVTRVQYSVPQSTWFPHPGDPNHVMTLSTRVGIGTNEPEETLDVNGNIRANGALKTDSLCGNRTPCFNPRFITEANPCLNDGNNTQSGVIEMSTNNLKCASAVNNSGTPYTGSKFSFPAGYVVSTCPGSQVQQGFTATGGPLCVSN